MAQRFSRKTSFTIPKVINMRGDNTGVPLTCPIIDDVIWNINWVIEHCRPVDELDTDNFSRYTKESDKQLEVIRKHNSELREFGNDQYKQLYEMEKDRDHYKDLAERLQKEVDDLTSEIKELEKQLSEA